MFYDNIKAIIIFGVFVTVKCGPVHEKRAAFDPEQLMKHYMDMRTDQGLFGSYHPNDLVQTIVSYFNGRDPKDDNQWGLFVYNPNNKIGQYMGNMDSPGNLGPKIDVHNGNLQNDKSGQGSAFNPNALNERLLKSAFSEGSQFSNFVQSPVMQNTFKGQGQIGFNPDALNQKMMEKAMEKGSENGGNSQSTTTPSRINSAHGITGHLSNTNVGDQIIGFNPDTLNAGLLDSLQIHNTEYGGKPAENSGQGHTRMTTIEFNPDQLNAGLLKSIQYNPNSALGGMSQTNGKDNMLAETNHGAKVNGGSPADQHSSSGSSPFSGLTAMTGNFGKTDTQYNGGQGQVAAEGSNQRFQSDSGKTSAQAQMTSVQNMNQSGVMPLSSEGIKKESSFQAGGIGPQANGKQDTGSPPGVPTNSELKQSLVATVRPHGIGGMG